MNNIFQDKIQTLLTTSGIEGLSGPAKDFVLQQLGEQTFQRVIIQMSQDLPEDKVSAFLEFAGNGSSDESLSIFMQGAYPQLDDVLQQKTLEVLEEYKQAQTN
jgi:hypothetical protein